MLSNAAHDLSLRIRSGTAPGSANGDLPGHRLEAQLCISFFNIVEFTLRNPFRCSTNVKAGNPG